MTTVTWARHGENLANVTRTLSFRVYDESLTERAAQARDLAMRLAAGPTPRIVAHHCGGSRDAAIVAEVLGREIYHDEISEVDVGRWTGVTMRARGDVHSVLGAWRHGEYAARLPHHAGASASARRRRLRPECGRAGSMLRSAGLAKGWCGG